MPKLRDGSVVSDPRLACLPFLDPRSLAYKIRDLFTPNRKLKGKTWRCMRFLNQGREGACVGFAWAHELVAQPSVVRKGVNDEYAREKIYWEAQKIDKWRGGAYPGAAPFLEGSSVLAGAKVLQKLGFIEEYRWAFGIEDLKGAVDEIGPAVLGIPWYQGMAKPNLAGFLRPTGDKVGNHAILCRGVSLRKKAFLLHNSWGKKWGDNATAWVSFDDMATLLSRGGEACIPTKRVKKSV